MKERSCVYKFIDRSQKRFSRGESLESVLDDVDKYRIAVRKVYGFPTYYQRPLHRLGTSKFGLSMLARYEYLRSKGYPLPNANNLIESCTPVRDIRRWMFGRKTAEDCFDKLDY